MKKNQISCILKKVSEGTYGKPHRQVSSCATKKYAIPLTFLLCVCSVIFKVAS